MDTKLQYVDISDDRSMFFTKHYKVLEIIGEGSFSQVYKIENKFSRMKFAEKRLNKIFKSKAELNDCLEIQMLNKLEYHTNIVQIVDIIYDPFPGYVHIIFELMDMNLYDFIKSQQYLLLERKVKNIMYQLVCAVEHLHNNNLFHRDIKPENILMKITSNKLHNEVIVVKLADLGSASFFKKKEEHYTAYIATRWYRPPECILTMGSYNQKIDIWAIGCIFFEILTFKPLFPGDTDLDQLFKINEIIGSPTATLLKKYKNKVFNCQFPVRKPLEFSKLLPELSSEGQGLLKGCLAYDPDERFHIKHLKCHKYFNSFKKSDELNIRSSTSLINLTIQKRKAEICYKKGKVNSFNSKTTVGLDSPSANLWNISNKKRERAWGPAKNVLLSRNPLKK